jgi:flagellar biosynthesis protein FlhA
LGIDVGEALLPLLDEPAGSALLHRIGGLRRALALELGVVLPGVHVRDDLRLPQRGFAIRVRDRVVARGHIHPDRALAIASPAQLSRMPGEATIDPVTGSDAKWLSPDLELESAEEAIVVDPIAVLTSKLGAVVRDNAAALLGRQEVQWLLDHVRRGNPAAVKGVVPELAGLGLVQRVLQHLVRERVSIRDLVAILEAIADEAEHTKDASIIGEAARRRLAPSICATLADPSGIIRAAALTAAAESSAGSALVVAERGATLALDPPVAETLARHLASAFCDPSINVLVCAPSLRLPLARFVEMCGLRAAVLSLTEVAPGYAVEIVATIALEG